MIDGKTICVVTPAFNEGKLISKVIKTMPEFVDRIIIVEDGSSDDTLDQICSFMPLDKRICLIRHEKNMGLGQSLIDGYLESRRQKNDVTAVMAGDAQMAPEDLESIVKPIVDGITDYTKGSRLLSDDVREKMPTYRFIGNNGLTFLSKFATGYWHVVDTQCGYTAISLEAISSIPIESMVKGYGYNANILQMLNLKNFRVKDVKVKPVYGEEKSKIKLWKYIRTIVPLLWRLFWSRMKRKYLLSDFNPLVLFYLLSMFCIPMAFVFAVRVLVLYFAVGEMPNTSLILFVFLSIMGIQSLFFGMWMDMEDNRRLQA